MLIQECLQHFRGVFIPLFRFLPQLLHTFVLSCLTFIAHHCCRYR
jgi:hypothetical protein